MDFAAEPVLDAFTPPPRAASRVAPSDDTGPSFDEHLEAVNEAAPESPVSTQTEPKSDTPSAETKPVPAAVVETPDATDADTALLGAPQPAPPVIAAPLAVQIAAAQPAQTQPAEASAPSTAPQAPAPTAPTMEAAAAAEPVAPFAPNPGKSATDTKNAPAAAPASTQATTQAQSAPVETAQTPIPTSQAAPTTTPAAPIAIEQLPPAVQQAIAATIAPAPPVTTDVAQRVAKASAQTVETKTAPEANAGAKNATAAPNAKTQTAKAVTAPAAMAETALAPQAQSNAADSSAQPSALSATATQASTHTQHVAADTGAQRAAPAAAQVGREIIRRFDGGSTSFEFRLDPAELGRVEVRMDVSRDHRVTAVISADSPQALTELVRHARELEAQLQSAGLQLSDNGLSFDLRQNAGGSDARDASATQRAGGGEETLTEQQPAPTARPIGFERWRGVRVDMMV